jgi:hypothetical protein
MKVHGSSTESLGRLNGEAFSRTGPVCEVNAQIAGQRDRQKEDTVIYFSNKEKDKLFFVGPKQNGDI